MAPLTPDRVMEGRPFAARDSRLFKLPLEILSFIIRYLDGDKQSLASLALVNSDCRQLARSCQFQTIVFESSPSSTHLLGNGASLRTDNPQFTAVGVRHGAPPAILEPLISALGTLSNLKVLSLQWNGTLHITSGNNGGRKHDWFVDHDRIRSNLSPLRKLKKLALTRDTYRIDNGEVPDGYYSFRTPTADEWEILRDRVPENLPMTTASVLELSHLARMKLQADKYVKTFRRLEWIHLGQLSFPITADAPGRKRKALYPDRLRDPDFPVYKELFGMKNDNSHELAHALPAMIID
ncbi:hypothetical protein BJX65DRAFT_310202 [Aspergillus insuetus]